MYNIDNVSDFAKYYTRETIDAMKMDIEFARRFEEGFLPTEKHLRDAAEHAREVIHANDDEVEYIYRNLACNIVHRIDLGKRV